MSYWNLYGRRVRRGQFSLTMRILITGGFGFVGGRLAVYLAQFGHQIILGTRHSIDSPEWLPQAEVAKIAWHDELALERLCDGVDVIIHAAGMNAKDCAADPMAALTFNGLATARLVTAANEARVKKIIYLSTAHVYANPLVGTITEETSPRNLHPYATSHLAGEHAVLSASNRSEIQGIVLRLSNVFGAPMHKDVNCWMLLVNDLCKQAVQTRQLVLQTTGLQRRDFVTLEDVSRAILHVISIEQKYMGEWMFNVGGDFAPRVIDMAELVQERCSMVLGFTPKIVVPKSNVDIEMKDLNFRIDRFSRSGFELSRNINAEIDATLQFCRKTFEEDQ